MNIPLRVVGFASLVAFAIPAASSAEFTVTIHNKSGALIEMSHAAHQCIHDPSYFDKSIEDGESVKITAKWIDGCPGDEYIRLAFRSFTNSPASCWEVKKEDKYKQLEIRPWGVSQVVMVFAKNGEALGRGACQDPSQ